MALSKTGYRDAVRGVATVRIGLNADGNIAQDGESVAGVKKYQLSLVNAANGLEENTKALEVFVGLIAGGKQDSLTSTMRVNWSV